MKDIFSSLYLKIFQEKDFEDIKKGYLERSKGETLTQSDKQRLGNLAYLISQGKADVKFGLVKNGLFHTKWGLFEDRQRDVVYFNGTYLNQTLMPSKIILTHLMLISHGM